MDILCEIVEIFPFKKRPESTGLYVVFAKYEDTLVHIFHIIHNSRKLRVFKASRHFAYSLFFVLVL